MRVWVKTSAYSHIASTKYTPGTDLSCASDHFRKLHSRSNLLLWSRMFILNVLRDPHNFTWCGMTWHKPWELEETQWYQRTVTKLGSPPKSTVDGTTSPLCTLSKWSVFSVVIRGWKVYLSHRLCNKGPLCQSMYSHIPYSEEYAQYKVLIATVTSKVSEGQLLKEWETCGFDELLHGQLTSSGRWSVESI